MSLIRLAAAPLFLALALPAGSAPLVKTGHVEAELVADRAAAAPGKPTLVGLKLRMEPNWHTYWKNPGDSGLPTRSHWVLPAGWKAGEILWPFPQPLPVGPLMNYGYEDEVVLLAELTPPADAKPGAAPLKAKAEWLVCKDICIPEKGELDFTLPVAATGGAPDPRWQAHIDRARNLSPADPPGWEFESSVQGQSLVVRLTPPEGAQVPTKATFFPEREGVIEPAAPQKLTREGRALRIEMRLADPPVAGLASLKGVAVSQSGWAGSNGRKAIAGSASVASPLAAAGATSGGATSGGASACGGPPAGGGTFARLAFALMGGLLLNLMPCVFPVLGIKVLGFVEHAHADTRAMRLQGLTFLAGVLVSFVALAGLMLALRAGGAQLGWG